MIRNVAAIVAGIVITFGLIWVIELLGHTIYPVPADLDFTDAEAWEAYVATLPVPALLFPMFAWFIGTFVGSLTAGLIGSLRPIAFATIIGLLVLAGTIANLIFIPHPLWFSIFAVIGIGLSAWLAVTITEKVRSKG